VKKWTGKRSSSSDFYKHFTNKSIFYKQILQTVQTLYKNTNNTNTIDIVIDIVIDI
jgi:hypothetical protein